MKIIEITKHRYVAMILLAIATIISNGCSTQTLYESAKQGAENNCRNQPPSEADRCLESLNKKSYEEYEKERATQK